MVCFKEIDLSYIVIKEREKQDAFTHRKKIFLSNVQKTFSTELKASNLV